MSDFNCKYTFNIKTQSYHPNDLSHMLFIINVSSTNNKKSIKLFFTEIEESIENNDLEKIIKSKLDENFDMQELYDIVSCDIIPKISNKIEEFVTNEGLI